MSWLRTHFLGAEVAAAALITVTVVLIAARFPALPAQLPEDRTTLYATLASIFGALLGFVIAAIAIVLTLAPDPRLELVTSSPHYATLWRIFFSATRALGIATAACVFGLVADRKVQPQLYVIGAVLFSGLWSCARVWRCIWVMERLVAIVVKKASTKEGVD